MLVVGKAVVRKKVVETTAIRRQIVGTPLVRCQCMHKKTSSRNNSSKDTKLIVVNQDLDDLVNEIVTACGIQSLQTLLKVNGEILQ